MPEIQVDLDSNELHLGNIVMEAMWDRIIVLQDDFRSGYECATCMTRGEIPCDSCGGSGKSAIVVDGRCSKCQGRAVQVCPDCNGQGATIHVPKNSETPPTTGRVISVGDRVKMFKRGESVIYPSYVGHRYQLSAKDIHGRDVVAQFVIMRDEEALAKISGHLELRQIKKSEALGTLA